MPYPVYETKGTIKAEVLARCGYGGLGAAAGNFVPYIDSLIVEAQEQIFELLTDEKRKQEFLFSTVIVPAPEVFYDVPGSMDLEQIDYVGVFIVNQWVPVTQGIFLAHDSVNEVQTYPRKYQILLNPVVGYTQIKLWPEPDAVYPLKIRAITQNGPFVNDGDYCSVDPRLIKLYAIAFGKAHLGRKDAQLAMDAWSSRLKILRANQHGNERYIRGRSDDADSADPRPKVV